MSRKQKHNRTRFYFAAFILLSIAGLAAFHFLFNQNYGKTKLIDLPEGFSSHGIDVSHYQGDIDWNGLQLTMDSSISFVYIKVTEGMRYKDPVFVQNYSRSKALEIPTGAYHFFSPLQDAATQSDHFLNNYTFRAGDLPPVLDAETEGRNDAELINKMKIWLTSVERSINKRPIIYTSYHFYKTKFKGKFPGYSFWIANYGNHAKRMKDNSVVIWQYSDKGNLPGIKGNVDLNVAKLSFFEL